MAEVTDLPNNRKREENVDQFRHTIAGYITCLYILIAYNQIYNVASILPQYLVVIHIQCIGTSVFMIDFRCKNYMHLIRVIFLTTGKMWYLF